MNDSAAYYAAEILQPDRKWSWLEQKWQGDHKKRPILDTAREAVQALWEEEYKGKFDHSQSSTLPSRPRPTNQRDPRSRHPNDGFGALSEYRKLPSADLQTGDAYQAYLISGLEGQSTDTDPLHYWNTRASSQPDLARFAFDMLAIPVSSAECERVFSSSKLLLSDARNRLKPDVIEANECLRAWFAGGRKDSAAEIPDNQRQNLSCEETRDISWDAEDTSDDEDSEEDSEEEGSDTDEENIE